MNAPIYSALRDEQSPELQGWLQNAAKRITPEHRVEDETQVIYAACEGFFGDLREAS